VPASLLWWSFGSLTRAGLVPDPGEGVAADGTITTGADRTLIPERFWPALSAAVAATAAACDDASVYVYGSVATGQARPAQSDVDLLTVGLPPQRAAELSRELSRRFSGLSRGIEIAAMMPGDLAGESDEAYGNRVFLRHYCVHLSGPDRAHGLPRFTADARAARGFNGDIALHAARWRDALAAGDEARQLGRRLARKSLLAVAGLVSVHDATWTTDRALAAGRWAVIDPEFRPALPELLAWSNGHSLPGRLAVQRMLDVVTARIVAPFAATIGLWP
jgi:predicted nucleotidyltransferase